MIDFALWTSGIEYWMKETEIGKGNGEYGWENYQKYLPMHDSWKCIKYLKANVNVGKTIETFGIVGLICSTKETRKRKVFLILDG